VHTLRGWYLGYGGKLRDSISETFWQPVPPTPGFNQGVLSESPPQEHRLSELAMMVNVTRPGVHSPSILKIDPSLWEFGHNHAMTFGTEIDLMSLQEGFPGGILGRDFYTVVGLSHLIVRSGNRSRGDRAEEILVRTVAPSGTDVAISVLSPLSKDAAPARLLKASPSDMPGDSKISRGGFLWNG
jgi:hypothetical protein